ncbi:MAG: hypothetical protein K6E85_08315 [Lachnospiraceae bacterium]|nr:hypothetical protein [Lachnospiraceae bacterium]
MSKGDSHLFTGTSGSGQALIDEVISNGDKISPKDVVLITKDPSGKIVWLEKGNSKAGLEHIINEHGKEFNGKGIANDDIPNYVLEAVHQGNIVGYQGKRNPRAIYEFTYNGVGQRVAVQVGSNGFIVGANPKSMEE